MDNHSPHIIPNPIRANSSSYLSQLEVIELLPQSLKDYINYGPFWTNSHWIYTVFLEHGEEKTLTMARSEDFKAYAASELGGVKINLDIYI